VRVGSNIDLPEGSGSGLSIVDLYYTPTKSQ
jgi:hypothetical protein